MPAEAYKVVQDGWNPEAESVTSWYRDNAKALELIPTRQGITSAMCASRGKRCFHWENSARLGRVP